jgi:F-type H+-transporting ATPase subunit b
MVKRKYLLLLLLPVFAFASGGGEGGTDIVERTINFLIFASILYYFINKPLREFVVGRKTGIADKLDLIQQKLKESKEKKRVAQEKIEDAKKQSAHILESAQKEAHILASKIEADNVDDLHNLEKSFEEQKEIAKRKMVRSVVNQVVDEIFAEGEVSIDNNELINIVKKKVA